MARSRKKNPGGGWTCACSEKKDKQRANRRFRRINREEVRKGRDPIPRDVLCNPYDWEKDGKQWFVLDKEQEREDWWVELREKWMRK